jgi:DNA polymerase-1
MSEADKSTSSTSRKKLAIIDGKSVFYRGYYAMPNLSTKDGIPTGGVYGFAMLALEVLKKLKPDYVAIAWDKPKTNIRRRVELYPEYKAGRKPPPPDFYEQIPVLHELLQAFGWPLYECDDYEADDIMGTLAVQASKQNIETQLITSDLDMLQLINDKVSVYALKKGLSNIELFHPESFREKYGIEVDQFLDLKSLKGDSSDNIPGVPGIGEKGAVELLSEFKTLDNIYDNLALIKDSLSKKLAAGKELAYLSKELAAIWVDAPVPLNLEEVDGSKVNPIKIQELFHKLEFKNLTRQLPEIMHLSEEDAASNTGPVLKTGKNILIDSASKLKELKIPKSEYLYVYSRSAGKQGKNPQVLILSTDAKTTYTLDLAKIPFAQLVEPLTHAAPLVSHDVKNTLKMLLEVGITDLPVVGHDVLIGAFLLNSLRREQTLTELAEADLGYDGSPFDDLDSEELMARAPEIISVIKALHQAQAEAIKAIPELPALAHDIEWPVIPVLARMEYEGIELNTKYLAAFAEEVNETIADLEQEIYGQADQEFNIASPSQLADILFIQLELPKQGIKKGKTGYSTAASELDKLRDAHPIINMITRYREVVKLKNTYIDSLPKLVDTNSRLHTTFNLTIAQTGRLSSTDPNLQNIPVRTELGRHIRTAFVAAKGKKLVSADYSQFELRLAAAMSGDQLMIDAFNRGADIHTLTAAQVYNRSPEDVTKQMRRAAKVINFGVLYGMSPHGLSIATGMTRDQAQKFIDEYFKVRGPLLAYLDGLKEQARTDGYVATIFGRRRLMPDIQSTNFIVRQSAERAAMNMPIQGTEADLMKLAMIKVDKLLRDQHNDCNMLLQIHDSILIECPEEVAEQMAEMLKNTMENIHTLPVRLDVDTTIGDNWGEL